YAGLVLDVGAVGGAEVANVDARARSSRPVRRARRSRPAGEGGRKRVGRVFVGNLAACQPVHAVTDAGVAPEEWQSAIPARPVRHGIVVGRRLFGRRPAERLRVSSYEQQPYGDEASPISFEASP